MGSGFILSRINSIITAAPDFSGELLLSKFSTQSFTQVTSFHPQGPRGPGAIVFPLLVKWESIKQGMTSSDLCCNRTMALAVHTYLSATGATLYHVRGGTHTDEETEAPRGQIMPPGSHTVRKELGFKPKVAFASTSSHAGDKKKEGG